MLDKVIGTFGVMFVILLFTITGGMFIGTIGQWYIIQNEAQFLAASQGKYGGYTTEANAELQKFIADHKLDPKRLNVEVSAAGIPAPWGKPVTARITYNSPFKLGQWVSFDIPLSGYGRAVSNYLPGAYSVTYISPRW